MAYHLSIGHLEDVLRTRGERDVAARTVLAAILGDDLQGGDALVVGHVEALERTTSNAVVFLYESEQQVLGAHELATRLAGLLLG